MNPQTIGIADAKKHFSDLLGQVAYGKKQIIITKRGKSMALLVPIDVDVNDKHLARAKGWLKEDDPFFKTIENIVQSRIRHPSRLLTNMKLK